MPHVLVCEGHDAVNRLLCELLVRQGFRCSTATTPAEAESVLARRRVDLIILDIVYPRGDSGLTLLERAHREGIRALVVTAHPTTDLGEDVRVVRKPFAVTRLLAAIRELLDEAALPSGE